MPTPQICHQDFETSRIPGTGDACSEKVAERRLSKDKKNPSSLNLILFTHDRPFQVWRSQWLVWSGEHSASACFRIAALVWCMFCPLAVLYVGSKARLHP